MMPRYSRHRSRGYEEYDDAEFNRLPSGLFFTVARAEHMEPRRHIPDNDVKQKELIDHEEINYDDFVVPKYNSTKTGKEIYLPLLEVSIEVDVVGTVAWSKLTQTFTNRSKQPIKEATYCMPLYDKSTVTAFVCTIGSDKILKGIVKPKEIAKAEFKEAVGKQQVAALLEEHTPEVFETNLGNIPADTTVKVEISYITELKADLGGDGVLVTIPTSVAPRYGAVPSSMRDDTANSMAVPEQNGLQIKIQVSSPVAITKIESQTHPVSIEMGSHGTRVTKDIRDFSKKQESQGFDPKKAAATLSDRNASLGKDFVLLIHANDGQLLASRAISEPHPTIQDRSALMISINLRDLYTPNVVAPKTASEIIFVADRSGSMRYSIEALKTAMKFFVKSLPNNCIFNICSFGTTHKLMWPHSQQYNQENVDAALSYVANHFASDMGGTEIYGALRHVVENSEASMNTEIITLTDGRIWNTPLLFEFIQKTRSTGPNQNTRFFCLGIGEAVSHHLVMGIGRYGGGLAEVVATDSSGDWMQRVIGMLRAALTPSSWTLDIALDGVSISAKESGDKRCIQAPHQMPDFHAFSRSSVYFLLNQEFRGEVIKIKATSVNSEETFATEIPIEKLDIGKKWVHQLAAKAVLGDLESGRSWVHDKSQSGSDSKTKADADELAKIEGEKIGIEWNISSKWTSFIVVDEKSMLEKQSRWYQAGHSDLAELTRPRFEPRYNSHIAASNISPRPVAYGMSGEYHRQAPPAPGTPYHAPPPLSKLKGYHNQAPTPQCNSGWNESVIYREPNSYGKQTNADEQQRTFQSKPISWSTDQARLKPVQSSMLEPSMRGAMWSPIASGSGKLLVEPGYDSRNDRKGIIEIGGAPSFAGSSYSHWSPPVRAQAQAQGQPQPQAKAQGDMNNPAALGDHFYGMDNSADLEKILTETVPVPEAMDPNSSPPPRPPRPSGYLGTGSAAPSLLRRQQADETIKSETYIPRRSEVFELGPSSFELPSNSSASLYSPSSSRPIPSYAPAPSSFGPSGAVEFGAGSQSDFDGGRCVTPINKNPYQRSRRKQPAQQLAQLPTVPLTLTNLLNTHNVTGCFNPTGKLLTQLESKYHDQAWTATASLTFSPPDERFPTDKRFYIISTAIVVVYIEEVFAADKKLWDLVVQKARAWLVAEVPDQEVRKELSKRLRGLLRAPVKKEADADVDIPDSTPETEARPPNDLAAPKGVDNGGDTDVDMLDAPPVTEGVDEAPDWVKAFAPDDGGWSNIEPQENKDLFDEMLRDLVGLGPGVPGSDGWGLSLEPYVPTYATEDSVADGDPKPALKEAADPSSTVEAEQQPAVEPGVEQAPIS
ncbi:hypothetical protein V490_03143 [Pseudogymnoascus sp. VKM F-3557]|nr:hypothetical protein V490_03143 [Pseudogymnoascus sp. VKM F-3557]